VTLAGGRTVFRVRIGPFATSIGESLCSSLKNAGGFCQVAKNGAVRRRCRDGAGGSGYAFMRWASSRSANLSLRSRSWRRDRAGADVWFEAKTANDLFLVPRNGAALAAGDLSKRDFEGCASESYSTIRSRFATSGRRLHLRQDHDGRIGSFRIDGLSPISPRTLALNDVVWE